MVQFWASSCAVLPAPLSFQFHYGAILGEKGVDNREDKFDFNSTMVQFWVKRGLTTVKINSISIPLWCNFGALSNNNNIYYRLFQFHYGAILGHQERRNNLIYAISIPLWCNFGRLFPPNTIHFHQFQFHYGAILGIPSNYVTIEWVISIPLWCNFGFSLFYLRLF